METDPSVLEAIQACLVDKQPYWLVDDIYYKAACNWNGVFLPDLLVNDKGHFYVHEGKGVFKKPVSQKDRFLYHDSTRILAPRIVFCTFTKNHRGTLGECEDDFYFTTQNRNNDNISVDNLIFNNRRECCFKTDT